MQNNVKFDSSTYMMNKHPGCYDSMASKYEAYRCGMLIGPLLEDEQQEIDVLKVLEELGYPMQETGTYFYKDIIIKAKQELQKIYQKDPEAKEAAEANLSKEMGNKFSQFYFDIARNNLDMGLKTFHSCISLAHQNRIQNPMNITLGQEIGVDGFGDYKGEALLIANYMLTKEDIKSQPPVKVLGTRANV